MSLIPDAFPPLGRRLPRERGSAYIVALLALVVLTILGLALSLITQTEMQIGANEKTIQRVFYAADSGISLATSRAIVSADHRAKTYDLAEPGSTLGSSIAPKEALDVSPFYPILDSPCNLCEINNAGTYNERAYRKINHAVTATARRRTPTGSVLAEKTLSTMIEIQPWKVTPSAYFPLTDPDERAKIRF